LPLSSVRAAERREEGESGRSGGGAEKAVCRVAAGASLLGIVGNARSRTRETPFVTAEEPDRSGAPP
jgi:hypothetical protein